MAQSLTELERFLVADWPQQRDVLRRGDLDADLRRHLGGPTFDALKAIAARPRPAHLGVAEASVVFVPGVMGSTLHSDGLGGVWWLDMMFARDKLERLRLAADGESDADADAKILPATTDVLYVPFREAIARSDFGQSTGCAYDWRKPLRSAADTLRDRVLSAAARQRPVHLVGHSMGGLVIRTALMRHGDELWPLLGRIAFIGTPHFGSPSIAGYLKNHLWGFEALAIVGMFLGRETFRSLRGVLSLLPAPAGVYPDSDAATGEHPCANFDLYDAAAWKLDLDDAETGRLQAGLNDARQFHIDLHAAHRSLAQTHKDRMLMIAGVGQQSLFRLEFDELFWGAWERTRRITERIPGDVHREGDGRVPLASAQLEDVTIRYVDGVHGNLTNVAGVADDVLAWFADRPLKLARTPADALGGHLSADADEPLGAALSAEQPSRLYDSLPALEKPTDEFRREIAARLDRGDLSAANRARLL